MAMTHSVRFEICQPAARAFILYAAIGLMSCTQPAQPSAPAAAVASDAPGTYRGEFVTYVADFDDGHSERWHAVRTSDGREIKLDFDTPPTLQTGDQVRFSGKTVDGKLQVSTYERLAVPKASQKLEPPTYQAPAQDTYALVLVDLGAGANVTAAQGQTAMFSTTPTDKSFASYYSEVSYGQYTVSGDVIGPFAFSMTTCDTTGMYKAIEPQITGTYNHLIYYFNRSTLCDFGGLGEEGSVARPAKRTWMNGSLSCVVLMQEPGHNLGLMHANSIKCGTDSFSTTPATSCTITEYGSTMSTMGAGCKQFNAYERWYMQWLSGCNGVRVPSSGTFNLMPLETQCPGAVQVLQVPFPATLAVSDPQATTTTVNLKDYYVELRTAGGIFDAYSTGGRGGGSSVTFTGPTVFIYASDDVHVPATTGRGGGGNSVWTELINTTPTGTAITGLTAVGQSFVDPAGGPTITLQSIGATGATIEVTNTTGTASPTCIDGTSFTAPGPTTCGAVPPPVDGGVVSTGGTGGSVDAAKRDVAAGGTGGAGGADGSRDATTSPADLGTGGNRDAATAAGGVGGGNSGGTGGTGGGGGGSAATGGAGGASSAGGATPSGGTSGSASRGGSGGSGGQGGSGGTAGQGGSSGSGTNGTAPAANTSKGCACTIGASSNHGLTGEWLVFLGLALGIGLRRRITRAKITRRP